MPVHRFFAFDPKISNFLGRQIVFLFWPRIIDKIVDSILVNAFFSCFPVP